MAPRGKTKQQQVQEKEQEAQHEGPNEPQKEEEEPQEPQEEVAPVPQEETKEPQLEEDKSKDAEEEEAKVSGYVAEFFQTAIEKGAQAVVRDPDGQLRMIYKDKHDREQYEVEAIEAHKICGNSYRYLVRWKGYDDEDDKTWEPRRSFQEGKLFCQELLDYEKLHGLDPVPPPAVKKEKKEKPKPTAEPKKRPPGAVKAESAAAREDRSKRRKV
jgi:hypothetical protein